jgi:hypothetical protein
MWPWRAGIGGRISVRRIRRNRSRVGKGDALRLAKERHKNKRGKNCALQRDRQNQCAAAHSSFSAALLRVAFDKAPV